MKVLNKIRVDDILTELLIDISRGASRTIERFDGILQNVIKICTKHGKEVSQEDKEVSFSKDLITGVLIGYVV